MKPEEHSQPEKRLEAEKKIFPAPNPRCLTKKQLAVILNCSERSIENLVSRGHIRARKIPCIGTRFNLEEVEKQLGLKDGELNERR